MARFLWLILASIASLSAVTASLLPANHQVCVDAAAGIIATCQEGFEFYTASDMRCGCLSGADFLEPQMCASARIICDEQAAFSALYQQQEVGDMTIDVYMGCGCFYDATKLGY